MLAYTQKCLYTRTKKNCFQATNFNKYVQKKEEELKLEREQKLACAKA
jgi:hypothetical protein